MSTISARNRSRWRREGVVAIFGIALALASGLGAGCRGTEERGRLVDEQLVLTLEEARAWQHRADTHLADGDVNAAIDDVRHVLEIRFPQGAPEGEEARLDAWARLGKLHLATGDENAALEAIDRGAREATFDSFYRAHLETVRGEILEARGKRLAPSDPTGARAARRGALDAYARSIEINKRVQARLLKEGQP